MLLVGGGARTLHGFFEVGEGFGHFTEDFVVGNDHVVTVVLRKSCRPGGRSPWAGGVFDVVHTVCCARSSRRSFSV